MNQPLATVNPVNQERNGGLRNRGIAWPKVTL